MKTDYEIDVGQCTCDCPNLVLSFYEKNSDKTQHYCMKYRVLLDDTPWEMSLADILKYVRNFMRKRK